MRRAKRMNRYFSAEYRAKKHVLAVYDLRVQVMDARFLRLTSKAAWVGQPVEGAGRRRTQEVRVAQSNGALNARSNGPRPQEALKLDQAEFAGARGERGALLVLL